MEYLLVVNGGEQEVFRHYPDERRARRGAANLAYKGQAQVALFNVHELEPIAVYTSPRAARLDVPPTAMCMCGHPARAHRGGACKTCGVCPDFEARNV